MDFTEFFLEVSNDFHWYFHFLTGFHRSPVVISISDLNTEFSLPSTFLTWSYTITLFITLLQDLLSLYKKTNIYYNAIIGDFKMQNAI